MAQIDSFTSGTMAGSGSFRCQECGYVLTLAAADSLCDCPRCGGRAFARASLFTTPQAGRTGRFRRPVNGSRDERTPLERAELLSQARDLATESGEYLAYHDGAKMRITPLTREWTRVGRSLAADVRFDDPTVSRRHALIVRQPDGVRILDDRSLNGVFVNAERVEWSVLKDGDEIVVGRYHLYFLTVAEAAVAAPDATLEVVG